VTKSDKILFCVPTTVTAKQHMVYFQLSHAPAELTSPTVATQDVESELF
jgi:hypothetical protein